MPRSIRFTEIELAGAICSSLSWSEALRRLGYRPAGGNHATLQKYAAKWGISTSHFDPYASRRNRPRNDRISLDAILVEHSTYSRGHLKQRLYDAVLKAPICELCGQDETWRGRRMSMILDHINAVHDDNRLENLRILCPNCAATLDTHCGRKNGRQKRPRRLAGHPRECAVCQTTFTATSRNQRYCSQACWREEQRRRGIDLLGRPQRHLRKIERPSHRQLLVEIHENGYLATGRKYGVSDTAVRKWIRQYERERAIAEGRDPTVVEIPRRTWPNRRRDKDAA